MNRLTLSLLGTLAIILGGGALSPATAAEGAGDNDNVDFRYAPPEWQTAICLPDDPHKSLVDRTGELLYHYGQGGREFATRVGVEVTGHAKWRRQELLSPRVPIVQTRRTDGTLEIVEETFAVTDLRQPDRPALASPLRRVDSGGMNRNWAQPPAGLDASLRHIAVHMGGSIQYAFNLPAGEARRVALALCEGWWKEPGKRVQVLRVEGAPPTTVDTVADVGPNQAAAFWFDAKDANGDGQLEIAVEAAPRAADSNTILNGLWVFPAGTSPDAAALLEGRLNAVAQARMTTVKPSGPARNDLILVHVTNPGTDPHTIEPRLVVDTTLEFQFQPETQRVTVNDHETVTASLKMTGLVQADEPRRVIQLEPLAVPAGKSASFFVLYSGGGSIVLEPATTTQALACRERAVAYWQRAPLPQGCVQVPDPGIQALVDSAIRNIWQAREIKQGLPVFQVGPTCYRGLWIVDGAFLLEAAALVGAGKEARSGIAYTLSQQKPNGAFEVLSPKFYKENGIVLWTCVRHAMLTQDKAWLESVWPKLEGAASYLKALRQQSLEDATPLNDGLNPPGEIDGGLSGHGTGFKRPEFSNVHWNLLGLRAFIQAAHWLGKPDAAARWQKEYDDLYATFRKAAARDTFKDSRGNAYVPIFMANEGQELPQRGQWTFCHAVYPGQIFAKEDPLVASTLAMLEATEREGMVFGTGWDAAGIWNYFASFYAHAWLWQGNGSKAARILYAFANHAAPTGVWREEQSLRGEPFRKVGDMPHNWGSAEFIRLTVHLLALDRGDELHLLEGLPREWLGPGMTTRLTGVATPFGPLTFTLQADEKGQTATLEVKPLAANCQAVAVHLPDGATKRIAPQEGGRLTFALNPGSKSDQARAPEAASGLAAADPAGQPPSNYAVVVSRPTFDDPAWKTVVDTLVTKHQGWVLTYSNSVGEALPALRAQFPRYLCFVAPPEQVSRAFVMDVHRLARRLDDDPYTDCFWGILTGYDAANALRLAQPTEPLTIRKVAAGTELAMDMVEEGVWYCELNQNKMVRKVHGGPAVVVKGPDDTTESLVKTLNDYHADLFVTSGHATERDWQIGFRYRNGSFRHADGVLFGLDTQGNKFPIHSPNPKVYLPVGNCLMGHIDQRDCMATAWLNSAGVCQMLGYIQPTWYGYLGWGVLDYFVEQPGRYTFTEAFFANHHALVHRLTTYFPELAAAETDVNGRAPVTPKLSDRARAAGLTLNDARGLVFDRDLVAFYGDPAWTARLADRPKAFEQSLQCDGDTYTFAIQPRRGPDSFKPVNVNGSQRGGRPFLAYLPHRVREAAMVEGADLAPVVTDDFILVPNPGACDPVKPYRVKFTAKRM